MALDSRIKTPIMPGDTITIEMQEFADLKSKEGSFHHIVEKLDEAIAEFEITSRTSNHKVDMVIEALRDARETLMKIGKLATGDMEVVR